MRDDQARVVDGAFVPLADAHDVYVARTYAYVADGKNGMRILQLTSAETMPE